MFNLTRDINPEAASRRPPTGPRSRSRISPALINVRKPARRALKIVPGRPRPALALYSPSRRRIGVGAPGPRGLDFKTTSALHDL